MTHRGGSGSNDLSFFPCVEATADAVNVVVGLFIFRGEYSNDLIF